MDVRDSLIGRSMLTLAVAAALAVAVPGRALAEGYRYQGDQGFATTFSLIGGSYVLYVDAHVSPGEAMAGGTSDCIFTGSFQRLRPNPDSTQLGTPVRISTVPYTFKTAITLPAGLYRLFIAPLVDCSWTVLVLASSQNEPGLAAVSMLNNGEKDVATASLGDTVQFYAQYRLHADVVPESGELALLHGGKVVRTVPLQFGRDSDSGAAAAYVNVRWGSEDRALLGESVARFTIRSGSDTFVTTKTFTLTGSP